MIHRPRSFPLAVLALLCALPAATGSVLGTTGFSIFTGTVADPSGTPLEGAKVVLSGDGIGVVTMITDALGHYRFQSVSPLHVCTLAAACAGFRTVTYEGMLSEPGRTRQVDFRLKPPGMKDVVILATRDPFPHEEFVRGFKERVGTPTRVIDLDREPDPAEAVRRVRAEHPTLVVGAGLRAAQLIRREMLDVPSILTLITDPRRHDLESGTIGFVMDQPDADRQFERIASVLPDASRIGLAYDAVSAALLARDLKGAGARRGLRVEFAPGHSSHDLRLALDGLRGRIDALVALSDDLTATPAARETIIAWALRNRVPLAAPSPDWVERGALLSYGPSDERLGEETARLAIDVLAGTHQPAEFGTTRPQEFDLAINQDTAVRLGLTIPEGLPVETVY